jgi:hypothetical protein
VNPQFKSHKVKIMSDKNSGVIDVFGRLKTALNADSDKEIAVALGVQPTALNMQKKRGHLPREAIDALIAKEGLNAEWVYEGTGRMYLDDDAQSWDAGFRTRLAQCLGLATYQGVLVAQGYKATELKKVASGKTDPVPKLLRDMALYLRIDLGWLLTGTVPMSKSETELLAAFKAADSTAKAAILAVVASLGKPSKKGTSK